LNVSIDINRKDEIGELADAFADMSKALKVKAQEATKIAEGDMTIDVDVLSNEDVLGNAMKKMSVSLNDILVRSPAQLSKLPQVLSRYPIQVSRSPRAPQSRPAHLRKLHHR